MIGSARSPRPHERVVRHSRWQGPASSAQVSRSRAMPVGDRRSEPFPRFFSIGDVRFRCAVAQRCRPEAGGQFSRWGPAVARREGESGLRRPRRCAPLCRPEVGVPLPARREGEWASTPSAGCAPRCRSEVGVPLPARREASGVDAPSAALRAAMPTGGRRSLACAPLCRPEVGGPLPLCRAAGWGSAVP